jgi:hypothetical protein
MDSLEASPHRGAVRIGSRAGVKFAVRNTSRINLAYQKAGRNYQAAMPDNTLPHRHGCHVAWGLGIGRQDRQKFIVAMRANPGL